MSVLDRIKKGVESWKKEREHDRRWSERLKRDEKYAMQEATLKAARENAKLKAYEKYGINIVEKPRYKYTTTVDKKGKKIRRRRLDKTEYRYKRVKGYKGSSGGGFGSAIKNIGENIGVNSTKFLESQGGMGNGISSLYSSSGGARKKSKSRRQPSLGVIDI